MYPTFTRSGPSAGRAPPPCRACSARASSSARSYNFHFLFILNQTWLGKESIRTLCAHTDAVWAFKLCIYLNRSVSIYIDSSSVAI